jgi:hypothetical protein
VGESLVLEEDEPVEAGEEDNCQEDHGQIGAVIGQELGQRDCIDGHLAGAP